MEMLMHDNPVIYHLCFALDGPKLEMAELARRVGVSKSYLSMARHNRRPNFAAPFWRKLCGVAYQELIGGILDASN